MKISISGPAAAGKTYFVRHATGLDKVLESARIIHKHYPLLAENNLEKFRKLVFHLHIYKEQQYLHNVVFDRGVIDNLTFMLLGGTEYEAKKKEIISLYQTNKLKPYDIVFYFDVEPVPSFLLRKALQDPLRKKTINVENYANHVEEFKKAFLSVAKDLKLDDKLIILRAKTTKKEYTKRNEKVLEILKEKRV